MKLNFQRFEGEEDFKGEGIFDWEKQEAEESRIVVTRDAHVNARGYD